MPLHKYDKLFGGQRGAAESVLANMKKTYGPKKGEQVFYGTVAKREHKHKRGAQTKRSKR